MATVKTVLVKGRSNRSGKFPLVVQVLHKRRKKVVYTGFSIPDTLFDPVKGRVIDGGENTPESIRRINNRCESISRVLLKCISMIEKKSREYEIEDVFRTYGVLTREAGFYFYFSRKIRELRECGHEGTARAYASSLRSMQRYLGKKGFSFHKNSLPGSFPTTRGNYSLRVYAITPLVFICIISRLFSGRDVGRWAWNFLAHFAI